MTLAPAAVEILTKIGSETSLRELRTSFVVNTRKEWNLHLTLLTFSHG